MSDGGKGHYVNFKDFKDLPAKEIVANVIVFVRGTWRADGAEGETVHMLCNVVEALLPSVVQSDRDRAEALMRAVDERHKAADAVHFASDPTEIVVGFLERARRAGEFDAKGWARKLPKDLKKPAVDLPQTHRLEPSLDPATQGLRWFIDEVGMNLARSVVALLDQREEARESHEALERSRDAAKARVRSLESTIAQGREANERQGAELHELRPKAHKLEVVTQECETLRARVAELEAEIKNRSYDPA